jgi:hypothetical protein
MYSHCLTVSYVGVIMNKNNTVRFHVLTTACVKMAVMRNVVVCYKLASVSHVLTASIIRAMVLKSRTTSTRIHGAISQKTFLFKNCIINNCNRTF